MAKLRINGDSSGYVDLEAPNAASSSTLDLDQVPQKNAANTFTSGQNITVPGNGGLTIQAGTNGSASLRLKNDATDWDVNCQTTDNFAIYNHTTGGNRLGITPAGIVTMPNQPAFQAHGNQSWQIVPSGSVVPFAGVAFNEGSHYSASNHRFTAPISGKYMFINTCYVDTSYTNRPCMTINGVQLNSFGDVVPYAYNGVSSPEGTMTMQYIANLNAGDYVEVRGRSGYGDNRIYTSHSHFGGYLIG